MRYDSLVVDVMNIAYRVFDHKNDTASYVSKKQVYKKAISNFIQYIEQLVADNLHSDGDVYMLFDNMTSRVDLQSTFYFADRKEAYAKYKADREKQPKEFYNSVNLLKYYYLTMPSNYHTIQISRLEADDLVEPLLRTALKDKSVLLATNDLDWARFLTDSIHWIPRGNSIETVEELSSRLGFPVTQASITSYKVLFGDPSDNIPSIVPHKFEEDFPKLLTSLKDANDLPFLATKEVLLEKHPMLHHVFEHIQQCRLNLQLVNSIPVADKHLINATGHGRDSLVSRRAVRLAIGLDSDEGFKFGGLRRPRV